MKITNRYTFGVTMVFLGALFWSLNAPLVKYIKMDPILVCGLRSLIAGAALAPFIRLRLIRFNKWFFLYMVSYAALSITIIFALTYTSATIAIGMQYSSVIWLFLADWYITRRFNRKKLLPIGMIAAGVIIFMASGGSSGTMTGNVIALTEGFSFVGITVCGKKAGRFNPLGVTALANLFCGLLLCFMPSFTISNLQAISLHNWLILLTLGVVQIACGYSFFNIGIKYIPSQKSSIIAIWEMILGPIWVALLVGEIPSAIVITGFLLILAGMFIDAKTTSKADII